MSQRKQLTPTKRTFAEIDEDDWETKCKQCMENLCSNYFQDRPKELHELAENGFLLLCIDGCFLRVQVIEWIPAQGVPLDKVHYFNTRSDKDIPSRASLP